MVGFTVLVAAIDVVLLTAIATLGAFLYNMSAALLGGLEVTLAEDETEHLFAGLGLSARGTVTFLFCGPSPCAARRRGPGL